MATFLLWNVQRKPLDGLVQSLVRQHNVDVVLLVEYAFGTSLLPGLLARDGLIRRTSSKRFGVFTRTNHNLTKLKFPLGNRVGMWSWTPPSGQDGLLVLLHGPDRRNNDDSTRRLFFRRVADAVERYEKGRHTRTVVAGDFNAHPFESAVADADGLHAIGVRAVQPRPTTKPPKPGAVPRPKKPPKPAPIGRRKVSGAGAGREFFYNPMWRLYGHQQHPDAGAATHYWTRGWAHELAWFMLDQVVIRPSESARFPEDQLRIVTRIGNLPLLDAHGLPDAQTASDHLPLVFQWNL